MPKIFTNKGTEIIKDKNVNKINNNIDSKKIDVKIDEIGGNIEKNNIIINNETKENEKIEDKKEENINTKTKTNTTKKIINVIEIDNKDENKIEESNNKVPSEKSNEEKGIKGNNSENSNFKSGITGSINNLNSNEMAGGVGGEKPKKNDDQIHCCIIC